MSSVAKIRTFGPEDWKKLEPLYSRHFGAWAWQRFRSRWDWQFRDNPWAAANPIQILVGDLGGALVGHATSYPLPLRVRGSLTTIWCSGDLVTDPKHALLAFALAQQVERGRAGMSTGMRTEAERIAAFQGNRTIPSTLRAFAYPLRTTGAMQRALRRRLPPALRGLASRPVAATLGLVTRQAAARAVRSLPQLAPPRLEPIERFGKDQARAWEGMSEWVEFAVERSPEYLNWRYLDGPARETVRLQLRDARGLVRGFVVAGARAVLADDKTPCGTLGEVLEIVVTDVADGEAVFQLAHGALTALAERGVDAVMATGLAAPFAAPLLELGFTEVASSAKIMLNPCLPDLAAVVAPEARWYTSCGDGDQLYATLL